jgi:magnesium-protoporphyrin O-methyltransferase
MPCNCCEITDSQFDESRAKDDMKRYRKFGPAKQTQLILSAVRSLNLKHASLLDIGGGIGMIYHELMQDVVSNVIHVDASSAYLKVAKEESVKRGNDKQIRFVHADFTDVENEVDKTDVVTLDRVVCCYPNYRELLTAAGKHSKRALVMTYPRETWYFRIALGIINFFQNLTNNPFRVFIHPIQQMESLLNELGFSRTSTKRLFVWEMSLYEREVV